MLRKSPDIVIATPGRLIDHIRNAPSFSIDQVEVLILDEADRILDEYFQEQLHEIVKQCARTRQTLLFSATMTDAVRDLASVSLDKPVRIFVDNNQDVAFNLRQEFVNTSPIERAILASLVCRTFRSSSMVFVQTKFARRHSRPHHARSVSAVTSSDCTAIMSRAAAYCTLTAEFKDSEVDVLVATDVAARGLDIRNVKTVINFVMPPSLEHYIHRVGRTARAGRAGVSVSMCGESERKIVKEIIKRARNPVKSRIVPVEILEKYRKKVERLEPEIETILKEEEAERLLAKAENQANKVDNMIKEGKKGGERPREWFQSNKERMKEKERLKLGGEGKKNGKRKREDEEGELEVGKEGGGMKKKKGEDAAESRIKNEMNKVALLQARMAKRKGQKRKMNAVYDPANRAANGNAGGKKRKKTAFESDLTDVSQKNVKSLRYDASKHKRDEQRNNKFSNNNNNNKKKDFKKPKRWK
ncbi:hypothetical protein LSTR_LSTR015675 [Laodelphax striatellus]|uniref:RNA helicase n=1 Tax=Laodelphax striatellus TaxID=195883 RepID=A0A482XE07_LAOST|nr:hypothetical protein LSTR_LSTR015675 [Laodelphax striatellus]